MILLIYYVYVDCMIMSLSSCLFTSRFAEEAQVVFQKSQDKCGEGVTLLNKASAHMGMGEIEVVRLPVAFKRPWK